MSSVVCLFILDILLNYCNKFYSKRRNNMNQMSQDDDLFHSEYTFQRQDGNQRSSDTISMRTGPVGNPSETEYDEFNKIFHIRCATFPELISLFRNLNILYEFLPLEQANLPREIGLLFGNWNLAISSNGRP